METKRIRPFVVAGGVTSVVLAAAASQEQDKKQYSLVHFLDAPSSQPEKAESK